MGLEGLDTSEMGERSTKRLMLSTEDGLMDKELLDKLEPTSTKDFLDIFSVIVMPDTDE